MKKYLLYGFALAFVAAIGTAQPSRALIDLIRIDLSSSHTQASTSASQGGAGNNSASDKAAELELKRQAIQQRIEAHRAEVTEKLSGKRAEVCEQKELAINRSLNQRTAAAEKYLEKFKVIEERLGSFVAEKKLTVENAEALTLIMGEKRENAEALIGTAKTTIFNCEHTSAAQPGEIVRSLVIQEKQALMEYRDAIKSYAEAVKTAATTLREQPRQSGSAEQEILQ